MTHTCTKHQPGEACYCHCHCRCDGCGDDRATRQKRRRHMGSSRVPAERARTHLAVLHQTLGWTELAGLTGIGRATLRAIHVGRTDTIYRSNERRILAVRPREASGGYVDPTGTWRRLQALMACGWSLAAIGVQCGHSRKWAGMLPLSTRITTRTRDTIREAYDRLWNVPPPSATTGDRISITRTLRLAQECGFAPPLAWDDDEIDNPAARPHEWRRTPRTTASRADVLDAALSGASLGDLMERFGISAEAVEKHLERAGRGDLVRQIRPASMRDQRAA